MLVRGWTSNQQGVCGNFQEQVVMNLRRGSLVEWNGRCPSINDEHESVLEGVGPSLLCMEINFLEYSLKKIKLLPFVVSRSVQFVEHGFVTNL
jgi:hypothetical protein